MRAGIFVAYWPWFTHQEQTDLAILADDLGLDSVWVAEAWGQDAVSLLAYLAAKTERIALGSALFTYAMYGLWNVLYGPDPLTATLAQAPEAAEMLAPYSDLIRLTGLAIYAAVACVAIFAQGGMALYYFSRTKHLRAYLAQTPRWVIDFQKASASV